MFGQADDTRARLLKAAAETFAEYGYENATIREICSRAGANVALVNYHFGDKLMLYTEVLRHSRRAAKAPVADDDPGTALRKMIRAMVERAFENKDQANLLFRMMMHEFVHPTAATARVVDEVLRPVYDRLRELVSAILDLPVNHQTTRLAVHSILGQVAHYTHRTPLLKRLWPEMDMATPEQREIIANHIADVTLIYLDRARPTRSTRLSSSPRPSGPRRPKF
jgi:AcrR family transcriptional regulator